MKCIKLESLNDYVLVDETEGSNFIGYTTKTNHDINGIRYELETNREKYCHLGKHLGSHVFISQTKLVEALLQNDIEAMESGEVYEHGYPEGRLVPANHLESCEEALKKTIMKDFETVVDNIFSDLLEYQRSYE